jgi:hypothetical protein
MLGSIFLLTRQGGGIIKIIIHLRFLLGRDVSYIGMEIWELISRPLEKKKIEELRERSGAINWQKQFLRIRLI